MCSDHLSTEQNKTKKNTTATGWKVSIIFISISNQPARTSSTLLNSKALREKSRRIRAQLLRHEKQLLIPEALTAD